MVQDVCRRPVVAWSVVSLFGLLALLLPALVNGFPLVFADTGGYLARPFESEFALNRSALYGAFLAAGLPSNFWFNLLVQGAITSWVLFIALRIYGLESPLAFFAVIALLCVVTSLPWYVSQLMPDIFLPVAVLAAYLLAFASARLFWLGSSLSR
jgi:hypothetical protein